MTGSRSMKRLLRRALAAETPVEVANGGAGSLVILCQDGQRMEIKPGRAKQVILRRGKFHLLDCQCALCATARVCREFHLLGCQCERCAAARVR